VVLFGITRSSFVLLEPKTHEVLKEYQFNQLRRYAPSPHTVTLDFGDHAQDYVILYTQEADVIVEFITGYIDLALRRMKGAGPRGLAERNYEVGVESQVAAPRALAVTVQSSPMILAPVRLLYSVCHQFLP
jgi:hypothetical protein